jgi:hypothetical protein
MTKKKRRLNIPARKMTDAIEFCEYHNMNHTVEEIIKVVRWDKRK